MTSTYLDRILERHREMAAADSRSFTPLVEEAMAMHQARGFRAAIADCSGAGELAVISEIKRRSPSKGVLRAEVDPVALAQQYAAGGAACLSVLTDEEFFGGSATDLQEARAAVGLPVIRKDFTVDPRDVCDARLMGADCVLLIVAALSDEELEEMHGLSVAVGLDVLVEVHDEAELQRALGVGANMVGVNQRDLVTFEVDHERAVRMAGAIPDHVVKVAESGVRGPSDAQALHEAGYHAVLVGETLMRSEDPAAALRALRNR